MFMLNQPIKLNSTSQIVYIRAFDTATGKPKTGLVYNTSNLVIYTGLNGAAPASIGTLVTMTEGTWTSLGFKECANIPGLYQIGMPNAKLSSAVGTLLLAGRVTSDDTVYFREETIAITPVDVFVDQTTTLANAVVEAELTALQTYNRSANTTATITGPVSGSISLGVATDAAYEPIKTF